MKQVGIGTRVLNFVIDTLLIFLLAYLAHRTNYFYAFYYHKFYLQFYIWFYGTLVIYYLVFETLFKRTPGKWLSFTRVVTNKGGRPSFLQILIRTLVRLTIIDCFFIPFLDKTLHDYVSKTDVVEI